LVDRVAPRTETSRWYRFHLHQARWFGAFFAGAGFVALLWPLVLSMAVANLTATLWIYGLAILADITLFVLWLVLAMHYSQRAGNGELFEIPWIARVTGSAARK
jgi:hypothetical protein